MADGRGSLANYDLPSISGILTGKKSVQSFLRDLVTHEDDQDTSLHEDAALPPELRYLVVGNPSKMKMALGQQRLRSNKEAAPEQEVKVDFKAAIRRGFLSKAVVAAAESAPQKKERGSWDIERIGSPGDRLFSVVVDLKLGKQKNMIGNKLLPAMQRGSPSPGARRDSPGKIPVRGQKMPWDKMGKRLEEKINNTTSPLLADADSMGRTVSLSEYRIDQVGVTWGTSPDSPSQPGSPPPRDHPPSHKPPPP
ncbi:hypothetical protein T484DRAFT_1894933, partial [Baffinella frigidus]